MNFLDLPSEIILMVFSHVSGKDLAILRESSIYFKSIIDDNDFLWSIICRKEFDIGNCSYDSLCTHEFFYKYILHKYGYLVGIWIMEVPPYGGLSKIIFTSNGLTLFYLKQPIDLKEQVVLEAHVTIAINGNSDSDSGGSSISLWEVLLQKMGANSIACLENCIRKHLNPPVDVNNIISVNCLKCYHGPYKLDIEMISKDHMIISCENKHSYHMKRFIPSFCPSDNIIKPGIFMGDYGGHGVEFVSLEYHNYNYSREIIIRKLTGDPNVPAGEITVKVDLGRPMILNEGQQDSIHILEVIDTPILPPGMTIHTMPEQPFIVPIDCRYQEGLIGRSFQFCKSRFHSVGQISEHGFIHPYFIPGHFIIFDEDTFGHIWFALETLSMFKRVETI